MFNCDSEALDTPVVVVNNPIDPSLFPRYPFSHSFSIEFPTLESARIIFHSLVVDPELREDRCIRFIELIDRSVKVNFRATEAQWLRVSSSSFFELAALAVETIARLKDPKIPENAGIKFKK